MDSSSSSNAVPPTRLIHMSHEGNFQLECEATVLGITKDEENENIVHIQLDQTTMHPQGGGQPSDIGKIYEIVDEDNKNDEPKVLVDITKVTTDRASGIVTHTGTLLSSSSSSLGVGDRVLVRVDKETREIQSECHSAGHVVDSAMARCNQLLMANKGYHFLDGPYVEYKGKIPPEEKEALLPQLQQAFQDLIEEDIPTVIDETMPKEEALERVKLFDLGPFGPTLRLVTIAGWASPCGGTHIKSTACLKKRQWTILGLKSKKGVVRVKYGPKL